MALTTSGTLPGPVAAYYEKRWLQRAEENFVLKGLGKVGRVPKGEGKTVVWNRMTQPTAKTTALTEGTDPTPSGLSATLLSATLSQYGNFEQVTDYLEMTAIDTTVAETMDVLAYEAARSIDTVIANAIVSGGISLIVTGAYSNSAGFTPTRNSIVETDVVTVYDVRKAKRELDSMAAKPHTRDKYIGVAHPDVIFDLEGDDTWVNAHTYTEKGIDNTFNGEAGEIFGVRFIQTQQSSLILTNSGSGSAEVYTTFIMGSEFFGVSEIQDLKTYVDSPSPRSALRLYSDIGWKAGFTVRVLNDSFAQRIESGATQ